MSVLDLNPNLVPEGWDEHWRKLKQKGSFSFETFHRCKDGSLIPIEVSVNLVVFDDSEYNVAFSRNISERKQIEGKLRSSEERFQLAMAGANDGLWDWNLDTDEVYYSPRWFDMLGYPPNAFSPTLDTWKQLVHPDDKERVLQQVVDYLNGRSHSFETEMRMCHKNGHVITVLSRASITNTASEHATKRLVGTHVDITERKKIEQALRHSEAKFRDIFDASPVPYALNDEDLNITYLNPAFTHTFGYDIQDIPTLDAWWPKAYPDPDYRLWVINTWQSHMEKSLQYGTPFEPLEINIHCKDGSIKTAISRATKLDKDLSNTHLVTLFDITERKHSEALLETNQKKFSTLFESSNDSLFIHDMNGSILDVNHTACERLGYSKDTLLCMKVSELDTPEFAAKVPKRLKQITEHGTALFESAHIRKDGTIMPVEVSARIIELNDKTVAFNTVRDISERKQFEETLRQSQKMEAIGTLVGGIAHDFNNMLAAVQGNVYLARTQLQDQPFASDKLHNIEQLGMRASEMVQQLLTFARKDSVKMSVFNLNTFLSEAYNLASAGIPETVEHQCIACEEELYIKGDATQLQQVLMNLLNNATDAVADAEQPTIQCKLSYVKTGKAFKHNPPALADKQFACISVKDNGHGIPNERLDKIFEPFFTTKEVGKGTGLGLAMLYGAIQTHGGAVEVDSKPGKGAVFHIYLPLSEMKPSLMTTRLGSGKHGHGETILLVDDEIDVLNTTSEVLASLGYQVLKARNGEEALTIYKTTHVQVHLIISDVIMPRMGGVPLLNAVRKIDKKIPVILATGYDKDHVLDKGMKMEEFQLIIKPFDFNALSRVIQHTITSE